MCAHGDQPEGEPEEPNLDATGTTCAADLTMDMSVDAGAGAVDDVANQLVSNSLVKKGPSEEEIWAPNGNLAKNRKFAKFTKKMIF